MNLAFDILVITLASLLGILLILLIVIVAKVKKLIGAIEHVVEKGEEVVNKAEAAATVFSKTAGPLGAAHTIISVLETISKRKGKD